MVVADTLTADVILGCDFLRSQKCTIEMSSSGDALHVHTRGQSVSIAQDETQSGGSSLNIVLQEIVKWSLWHAHQVRLQ